MEGSRIARSSQRAGVGAFLLMGLFVVAGDAQEPEAVELVAHVEFRGTEDDRIPAEVAVEFLDAATRTTLSSVSVDTGSARIVDLGAVVPLAAAGSPWEVVARAESWWGPAAMVSTDRTEVDLVLVPAGTVRLELQGADRGVALLSEDHIGIVGRVGGVHGPSVAAASPLDPGSYRGRCEIERAPDERWVAVNCPFARGLWTDLEVLLGPFIPFRRSVVTVSDRTDFGVVEAVRGGVVAGRFRRDDGGSSRFFLRRKDASSEFARLVWTDNSNLVRFEGLHPGDYEMGRVGSSDTWSASLGSLYDAVDLGDLYPSRTRLAVSVLSPSFVRGDELSLRLQPVARSEDGDVYRRGRMVGAPSRDPGSGEWIWHNVPPGSYELHIGDRFGNRLGREPVEFFGDDRVVVELDAVPVQGEIRQGRRALADAMVWFGGAWGVERTALRSGEDGRFEGWLPRVGHWFVEVSPAPSHCDPCEGEWDTGDWGGFRPHPLREAGVVEVEVEGDGIARVKIELPAGGIEGRVFRYSSTTGVHEPVPGAHVSVRVPTGELEQRDPRLPASWQATSDAEGRFSIAGIPDGNIEVRATARAGSGELRSPWLVASVSKSAEMTEADLHMEEQERVSLSVLSPGGLPIDGAQVFARPVGAYRAAVGGKTRADGTVDLWLPSGVPQLEVVVRKQGMGMVGWRFNLEQGPLEIVLPDLRGSLRAPVTSGGTLTSPGGVRWDTASLRAINGVWQINVEDNEYVIGALAPGTWTYCLSERDCEQVDVTPWSESRVSR